LPDVAPLYPPLPYKYTGYRKVSVFCRANRQGLEEGVPYPLQPVSDLIEVFVMSVPQVTGLVPYTEGGIVVPVRYRDVVGGHVLYEYVSTDDALCAGREIWGYPKKIGNVIFDERESGIRASVERGGVCLFEVGFEAGDGPQEKPQLHPRLQLKRFPCADGSGFDIDQLILNELQDAHITLAKTGRGTIQIAGSAADPLDRLGPLEVVGAEFVVANFLLSHGRILGEVDVLEANPDGRRNAMSAV